MEITSVPKLEKTPFLPPFLPPFFFQGRYLNAHVTHPANIPMSVMEIVSGTSAWTNWSRTRTLLLTKHHNCLWRRAAATTFTKRHPLLSPNLPNKHIIRGHLRSNNPPHLFLAQNNTIQDFISHGSQGQNFRGEKSIFWQRWICWRWVHQHACVIRRISTYISLSSIFYTKKLSSLSQITSFFSKQNSPLSILSI